MTGTAIPQYPAQNADLEFEIAFLDKGIGPNLGDQFLFADDFASALDQGGKKRKRAAAQGDRLISLQQQLLCRT